MRGKLLCCLAIALQSTAAAWARPPHKQSLRRHYADLLPETLFACTTCHQARNEVEDPAGFDAESPPHNSFGLRLSELGEQLETDGQPSDIPARLRRVAAEDADADGVPNETEILSGHAPGNAADKPSGEELTAIAPIVEQFAARQAGYRWMPFEPVERPQVPSAARSEWFRNPVDAFIASEHQSRGLQPRPEAPRHVLLRRVYLDLIGLPPTSQELHAFLNDLSPDSYERIVEQLLASPQYGERWGRHWMDVWRYSDWAGWTDGKQIRDSQPHIWRWRDWIIESLNTDVGYDQMLREMLAADELYPADTSKLRATGYLVRNYKMLSRETWMQDTVMHTAQAFLGLTLGCARCHDHMYDVIGQDEYYRFRAIFEPHQVRLDRLPGQPDTAQDGVARAYDADVSVATYLYERGDDRKPDKDHPLAPDVPSLLGKVEFKPEPIALPPAAYYPGLAPFVQQETAAAAAARVGTAQRTLEEARAKFEQEKQAAARTVGEVPGPTAVPARDPLVAASTAAALAEKSLLAAQSALASVQARIAADQAKYADPSAADASDLALAAGKAEREAAWRQADADVGSAEQARASAGATVAQKPEDAVAKKTLEDAEKKLADLKTRRDAAEKARAESSPNYSPLTNVYATTSTGRRAAFARWLTDRRNPLAARVAVNHIWLRHFGQALVPSTFDFGQYGQPPAHPALVDWLASELMEPSIGPHRTAWSMKHLHWLIVTSATYRMASTPDEANQVLDADNRYLWRMNSRRMEAELVRDGVFYVAGWLDTAQGGPEIDYALGLTVPRRSIYFRHAQEKQMEFLKVFDCAAVSECYERKQSIVPQQALALANSHLSLVQARRLARRLQEETASDQEAFVDAAFEQVLSRPATTEERQTCARFIQAQQEFFASKLSTREAPPDADFSMPSNDPLLRAREELVHALLNHHDFVTIR